MAHFLYSNEEKILWGVVFVSYQSLEVWSDWGKTGAFGLMYCDFSWPHGSHSLMQALRNDFSLTDCSEDMKNSHIGGLGMIISSSDSYAGFIIAIVILKAICCGM